MAALLVSAAVVGPAAALEGPVERPGDRLGEALAGLQADPPALERGIPLSPWRSLDGSAAARPLAPAAWRQLVTDLRRAHPAWEDARWDRLLDRSPRAATGPVPIGLVNARVSRLREAALDEGRLRQVDGRLEADAAAFETVRVVAAAPLAGRTYRGGETRFVLPRELLLTNDPEPVSVEADFDDGRGYRALAWDRPFTVRWTRPGTRTIRVRLTTRDGDTLHASTTFDVRRLGTPMPSDTLAVTASVPHDGLTASGSAYVYLSDQNASLTNPVVVIEGFDLDNSLYWEELYELLNQENLVESMRSLGFDLVVLDFAEATEPIQRNAYLAAELLQQTGALTGGADQVVVGASMGGLVSRYALAWMEQQAIPHHTRTWVSFDTPHGGANIPLGIQYWLDFFSDLSDDAVFLLGRLDTPAARQMLLYHHQSPPSSSGVPDPLRADFLVDLAAVGDWPAIPRRVAFANGSAQGTLQGFGAGEQVIQYEHRSFLVDIDGDVYAVPSGGSQLIFDGRVDIVLLPEEVLQVTVSGTEPLDSSPGGWRDSMAQMDAVEAPYGDIVALHDNHAFIPTISSLALDTGDLFHDVDGDPDLLSITPFDALYFPSTSPNQEHVFISAETAAALLDELGLGVTGVPDVAAAPAELRLLAPRPNPFRTGTAIHFSLPHAGPVALDVFDVRGRRLARLLDGALLPAGPHAVTWRPGTAAPPGVYYYRVRSPRGEATGRLVRVR